jgi:hypothetical protein
MRAAPEATRVDDDTRSAVATSSTSATSIADDRSIEEEEGTLVSSEQRTEEQVADSFQVLLA